MIFPSGLACFKTIIKISNQLNNQYAKFDFTILSFPFTNNINCFLFVSGKWKLFSTKLLVFYRFLVSLLYFICLYMCESWHNVVIIIDIFLINCTNIFAPITLTIIITWKTMKTEVKHNNFTWLYRPINQ